MVAKIVLETIPSSGVGSSPTNLNMNKITRNKFILHNSIKSANNKLLIKVLSNNQILPLHSRQPFLFNKEYKFSTRSRKYCLLTGRARGVLSYWKVSRIVFKSFADLGNIPGITPASW